MEEKKKEDSKAGDKKKEEMTEEKKDTEEDEEEKEDSTGYVRPEVSSSESEDEDEDEVGDLDSFVPKKITPGSPLKQRASVSAEVFGVFNKKQAYVPDVIAKSDEVKRKIRAKLDDAFMFKMLEESEKKIVIDAMEEMNYKKGDYVIKQGEDGDVLYLVESGLLKCYKKFSPEAEDTFLLDYKPGMAFGE